MDRPSPRIKLTPQEEELEGAGPHVYDKAKWHYEGDYPEDLSERQAYVHTGMYIRWLIEANLVAREYAEATDLVKCGKMKGTQLYKKWGGVFASDLLTPIGDEFTREYYDERYFYDYQERLAEGLPSFYHVKESADTYRIIRDCIDKRFVKWRASRKK